MRRAHLLVLAPLVLAGCDVYGSAVPLDEPTPATFDESLLGSWVILEDDTMATEAPVLEVRRFNEREYLLEWPGTDESGARGATERARAYVTVIDGVRLLNVQDLDEAQFSFARYTVTGSVLRFRMIASGPEERGLKDKFAASAELRAAVRARLQDPLLYEEQETVARRIPRVAGP